MLDSLLLLADLIRAALRSRRELAAENLLLRQQLAVLARRLVDDWRRPLVLVRPEAVVAWHRRGWRLFWRWRSRCPLGRPRLSAEVRALIATIARHNPTRGAERIRVLFGDIGTAP